MKEIDLSSLEVGQFWYISDSSYVVHMICILDLTDATVEVHFGDTNTKIRLVKEYVHFLELATPKDIH